MELYSLRIYVVVIYVSLRGVYVSAIGTLYIETTYVYLKCDRSGILCPSRTHHAFLVPPIFTSQMEYPVAFDYPTRKEPLSSNISNDASTLIISLLSASC